MEEQNRIIADRLEELGFHLHPPHQTLYKYVDIDTAKKILDNGCLMYQNPEKFNDPLDPHLALLDFSDFVQKHNRICAGVTDDKHFYKESMVLAKIAKKEVVNSTGILCLSMSNTHTLMWSHYADKHTGVCFGFKEIGFHQADGIDAVQVKYADTVEPMLFTNPSRSNHNTIATVNLFCTKAKVWAYEQEVRIMAYANAGLHPIYPGYLCEIYFGVNTPEDVAKEVLIMALERGYNSIEKIGKMKLSDKKFDLEIELLQ